MHKLAGRCGRQGNRVVVRCAVRRGIIAGRRGLAGVERPGTVGFFQARTNRPSKHCGSRQYQYAYDCEQDGVFDTATAIAAVKKLAADQPFAARVVRRAFVNHTAANVNYLLPLGKSRGTKRRGWRNGHEE